MIVLEDTGVLDEFGDAIMVEAGYTDLAHIEFISDGPASPCFDNIVQEGAIEDWENQNE